MKSTKFWIILLAAVVCISGAAALVIMHLLPGGTVASVYLDGECVHSVDLSADFEPYTFTVSGVVENTISVEHGRICVLHSTCPDQVCVNQGWISNSVVPVVCLPNSLVIKIEGGSGGDYDAVLQ